MKGYPKHLNSKADFEYVQKHFDVELWLPALKNLLSTAQSWFFVEYLNSPEEGVTDDTHKVVTEGEDEENVKYAQYEYRINPTARIFRLGLTEEEVQKMIDSGVATLTAKESA